MNVRIEKKKVALNFRRELLVYVFIVVAVFAAYWQLPKNDFISFDDDIYVTHNPHIKEGFTFKSIKWAFTTFHAFNWHPVTWLSHMMDYKLFGKNASMHHFMNLFYHILNSILVFVIFRAVTKDIWPSAIVAILFAVHPLHVESVAWISERKDVLSTFFGLWALGIYFLYAKKQKIRYYLAVILMYALGLMAKPMLVTLPILLLLFDFWPLQRVAIAAYGNPTNCFVNRKSLGFLVLEKIPFFALSAASSIITVIAQKEGGIVKSIQEFPIYLRLANAFVSYIRYICKMILPVNLSFYYPYQKDLNVWIVMGALILIIILSVAALKTVKNKPFFFAGWFWYLITLLPVIGLIQVGTQSMADRYTYVPMIGLFIIAAWGGKKILDSIHQRNLKAFAALWSILITGLMLITWKQVRYWQNDIRLFSHAVAVTAENPRSNYHLGLALEREGDIEKAIEHYKEAIRIAPDFLRARNSMGNALSKQGKYEEALRHYIYALNLKKKYADGHFNLGFALMNLGKNDEAIKQYHKAIEINKNHADAHYNLGKILSQRKKYKESLKHFMEVVRINPRDAEAYNNMGNCYFRVGNHQDAIDSYKKALLINPDYTLAKRNLEIAIKQMEKTN